MMNRPKFSKWKLCGLMTLLLLCALAGGCWKPSANKNDVMEPPLIPAPPAAPKPADALSAPELQAFADQSEMENTRLYPPGLADAVARAIALGVLKPSNLQDRFEPERAITYGEFRQWALAYQNALYGAQALPSAEALEEAKTAMQSLKPDPAGPMSLEKLSILPEKLAAGSQAIQQNQALTRESLCHLYFLLTKQDQTLQKLSPAEVEGAFPPATGSGTDESLSHFMDYSDISPWARPAVALFYKSGQLQQLFRLTPAQLTLDTGFGPQKPANRGEAIVLLHWVYGKIPPKEAEPRPSSEPATAPHAKLRLPDTAPAPSQGLPPSPLGHWKFLDEKSPQGNRKVLEVNGPD
jgi:hypothetical protein